MFDIDPNQIEFIAEKIEIGIVPNFSFDPIYLISGTVGPFRAGLPVHVPLWLAINLRSQQKCTIVPPHWMNVDRLEEIREQEKQARYYTKMPCEHYMNVATLIIANAAEDLPHSDEIRTIIKDIWDTRTSKLRNAMANLVEETDTLINLDNLTQLEIQYIRPEVAMTLDTIQRIQNWPKKPAELTSAQRSSTTFDTSSLSDRPATASTSFVRR